MARHDGHRAVAPAEVIARWRRTIATLADNDNEPRTSHLKVVATLFGVPAASTVGVAACLRYLF